MKVPKTALRSAIALAIGVGLAVTTPGAVANAQNSITVVNPTGGSTGSTTDSGLSQTQLDKDWAYARAHLAASPTVWSAKAMRAKLGAQSVSDADLKAAAATASPDEGWTITVDAQLNPVTATRTPKLMTTAITVTNQCPSGYSCAIPTTPYAYTGFTGTGTITGNWPGKTFAESRNYLITFCTNAGVQAACSPKYPKNSRVDLGGTKTVIGWGNFTS